MVFMPGTWTRELVGDKPADVYQPPGRDKPRFAVLFLHDVGTGLKPVQADKLQTCPHTDRTANVETLKDRPTFTRLFDAWNLPCVCPHGCPSWWTDRLCPQFDAKITAERHVLDHVIPLFRQRWNIAPPAIGLLGISMGGQGALRLALRHPDIFRVAAGIASAIDYHELYGQGLPLDDMYDSKEQCRQDTALMHIDPYHYPPHLFFSIDPADTMFYRGNDRLHEKLSALGVPHTADLTTAAGGHSWDYFNAMAEPALRFLVDGLEKESRRLL